MVLLRITNKHQSPIVDRGVLEELMVSSALLDQNSSMINKVYQSKHKAASPKAATSRVPEAQPMGQASPKHNKSTKGRVVSTNKPIEMATKGQRNSGIYQSECVNLTSI